MKKIFIVSLPLLLLSIKTIAQNNLPPVYEITSDTAINTVLNDTYTPYAELDFYMPGSNALNIITLPEAYWQMIEDRGGKLTIDEVSKPPLADKFVYNTTRTNGIDYSIRTYWIRYRFKNDMPHEVKIAIPENATYADFYTPGLNGTWDHQITGNGVPWSKRDGLKRITTVIYTIPAGKELMIYERYNFDFSINEPSFLKIDFGFADKIIQEYYVDDFFTLSSSFLLGFLLLAALYNLYFFLIIRERVYLLFSLTLLFRGLSSNFLYYNNVFLSEHPITKYYYLLVFSFFYFFFLIHFVRYFLETFKHVPLWDKFLKALTIFLPIFTIVQFGLKIIPFKYQDLGFGSVMLFIVITFILFIRSGNKSIRWSIVAVLPGICVLPIPLFYLLFSELKNHTTIPIPGVMTWLFKWFDPLEEISLMWLLIFFSWSLFKRYQQLQKQIAQEALEKERLAKEKEMERSRLIAEQKVELETQVTERTSELKHSLEELKSTQAQLIQQEKMASLGELTAGIAHEIQNPLNFVNNFSEVNTELIEEAGEEIDKGNISEVKIILNDIKENEQKIIHHGKRADSIVKGMLQHSRVSTGQKELTDINALADEYLRLSYHGVKAKDKTFNATLHTDFDSTIGQINVVPQDIGRALLNLFNNAFYSVMQKRKNGGNGYEPTVSVYTTRLDIKVEIHVKDNGTGIPQKVVDKIFQPFFTTKPTGQGTGLGLSLAYDIIKAHGGEIKVETKEGEGSEFVVRLPTTAS